MYRNSLNVSNMDKLCDQIQHTELYDSDEENVMETDHSYNYSALVRFLVLEGSVPETISLELLSELNNMNMPQFFGFEGVVCMFGNLFDPYFNEILESIGDEIDSFEMECATSILSRCVILAGEPSVFTFLLVAAFLHTVIFEGINEYSCFRILPISEFCFEVLYKRLFHTVFVSERVYEYMFSYFDTFRNKTPAPTLEEFQETRLGQFYTDLIKKCVEVNIDASFTLTDSEKEMYHEICSLHISPVCGTWSLSHKFDKGMNSYLITDEVDKVIVCNNCQSKCYSYLDIIEDFF
ncbi:hypothetical protein TNIN_447601 [Trichonephila inaurata madagascariensis]|uniref:Uncharacterized protein n=1 Tax=Trichonephila inaurata madagascariensis TaxID=2747483 RepID=A0A8X7CRV0_9ARAC|nr:hypothetical protein TNIN_447601 [Trichonephila inaurata madagascariensis]